MRNIDIFSWEPEADKDVFFHRDKFRNKKVHHMYMDTELNYQTIRDSFPKHLQELYDTPIEYKWNNDTFRDYREFSKRLITGLTFPPNSTIATSKPLFLIY